MKNISDMIEYQMKCEEKKYYMPSIIRKLLYKSVTSNFCSPGTHVALRLRATCCTDVYIQAHINNIRSLTCSRLMRVARTSRIYIKDEPSKTTMPHARRF